MIVDLLRSIFAGRYTFYRTVSSCALHYEGRPNSSRIWKHIYFILSKELIKEIGKRKRSIKIEFSICRRTLF